MKRTMATLGALAAITGAAAADELPVSMSGNFSVVSDYRARGLTVSDHGLALQGGFDLEHESGFSAGVWASSLEEGGDASLEVDLYLGQTFALGDTELAVGGVWYAYPDTQDLDYGEVTASLSRSFGVLDGTFGLAYAWEQTALGDEGNSYVFANASAPIGAILGAPITAGAGLGYEEGPLAAEDEKVDWSVGLAVETFGFELALSYVGTDLDDPAGDDGAVLGLSRSF